MTKSFHKSSYSNDGAHCVEVSEGQATLVRDSQNPTLGMLSFSAEEWVQLVRSVTTK